MLGDVSQAPPAAVEAVQHQGLTSLLDGAPLTATRIAELSELPANDIEQAIQGLIEVGRIELDGGRVIGVGGLTLTKTVHSVRLPTAEMHTWCALDAIGIPVALGLRATVTTRCPQCGDSIAVAVDDQAATAAGPVILFCPTGPCDNVRADFCSAANLFCDATHLAQWRASNPATLGEGLDLPATVELGRAIWGRYRDKGNSGE